AYVFFVCHGGWAFFCAGRPGRDAQAKEVRKSRTYAFRSTYKTKPLQSLLNKYKKKPTASNFQITRTKYGDIIHTKEGVIGIKITQTAANELGDAYPGRFSIKDEKGEVHHAIAFTDPYYLQAFRKAVNPNIARNNFRFKHDSDFRK
ncbi:hypothetical protein HY994_02460, partial [Candidatus Micrarchaeota archaeon]|nr:hypothetical protein [Candidatus Micrarchaeota archaeon]